MNTKETLDAGPWIAWGEQYLHEHPVLSVEAFETALTEQFRSEMTALHEMPLQGRSRKRKLNLTDHVKASLTRRGLISYVTIKRKRLIVFLPEIGNIAGFGRVYDQASVWGVIRRLVDHADPT